MKYIIGFICVIFALGTKANLLISPTRLNFDSKDRVQEVMLVNTTSKERTYRIEWSEKKALALGGYEELAEDDDSVARLSPYMRFSPRQVRLAPGERQTIKIQLRRKADMQELEYRSHLKFVALPPEDELPPEDSNVDGMRMSLDMLLSYSIPVVYHPVEPLTSVSIDDFALSTRADDAIDLYLQLTRRKTNSAYGRIEVYTKVDGKQKRIGLLNNVAIFKELDNAQKSVLIPNYRQYGELDELTIKYIGEKEYKGQTLAERTVRL
ncbi:MAG: fimbria/pilus periplasmic chaperone [Glaciecola sp.]